MEESDNPLASKALSEDLVHIKIVAEKFQQVRTDLLRSLAGERARNRDLETRLEQAKQAERAAAQALQRAVVTAKEYALLDRIVAKLREENKKCRDEIQEVKNRASVDADVAEARVAAWERNSKDMQRSLELERQAALDAAREARDAADKDKKALLDAAQKKEEETRLKHEEALSALRAELMSVAEECAEEMNLATLEFEDRTAQMTERMSALEAEKASLHEQLCSVHGQVDYLQSRLVELQHAHAALEAEKSRLLESNRSLMLQQQSLLASQRAARAAQQAAPAAPAAPAPRAPYPQFTGRFHAPAAPSTTPRFQTASTVYSVPPPAPAGSYPQLSMAWRRGVGVAPQAEQAQQEERREESVQVSTHSSAGPPSPPKTTAPRRRLRKAFEAVEMVFPARLEDSVIPASSSRPPSAPSAAARPGTTAAVPPPAPTTTATPQAPSASNTAVPRGRFTFKRRMFTTEPSAVAAGDSPRKPIAAVLFPRESPEPLPEVTSASPPKKTPEHLPEVTPALLPKMPAPLPEVTSPPLPRKTPAPLSEVTSPPLPKKAPAPLPEVRPAPLVKPAVPAALEAPAPGPSSTTPAIEGIQEAAPFQPSLPARKVTKKPPKAAETRTKTPMVSSPPAVAKAAPAAPRAKGSRRLFSSSAAPESYLKFLSKLPASKMHFTIPAVKDAAPPPPPPPPPPKPTEEATSRESTRQFFQRQVQLQDQAPFSAPETQIQEPVTRLEDPAGALESKTQRPVSRPEGPSSASELQIQEQGSSSSPEPQIQEQGSSSSPEPQIQEQGSSSSPEPQIQEQGSSSSPEPQIQEQGSSSSPEPQIQEQAVLIQATASVPDPPIHDRAMLIESTPSVLEPQIREQAMVVEATASAPESQTQDQAMLFEAPESAPVPQIQDQAMQIESTVSAPEPQIRDQAMQIEVPGNAFAPPEQVQGVDEDPNVPSAAPGDSADHSSQSSERVAAAEEKPAAAQLQAPSKPSMERMFSNDSDASSLPATQAVDASQAESRDLEAAYVLPDISLDTGLSLSTVCGTMGLDSELAAPTLPRALEEADVDPIPPPPPSLAVHHDLAVVGVAEEHACSGPAEEGTVSGVQLPPPPRDTAGKGDGVLKFAKDVEAVTNASRLVTWLSTVVPEKDPVATSPPRLPQATLVARPVLVDAAPVDDLQSAPTPRREPESGMSECPSLPCSPPGPAQNAAPADPGASMDDTLDLQSMPTPKFDLASGVPKCPSLTCSPPGAEGIPSVLASLGLGRRNLVPMLASPGCSFPAATSVIAPGTSNTATPLADDQDADEDPLRDADESISYSPLSSSVDDESPRPLVIDCSPWTTRPPLPREQAAALQGGEEAAVGGRTGLRFLQESYAIGCSQLSKRGSSTGITPGSNTPATCASVGTDKGTSTLKRSARPSPSPSEDRDSPSSRATPSATLTTPRRAVPLGVREKKRRRLLWVEPEAEPEVDRETGPADE